MDIPDRQYICPTPDESRHAKAAACPVTKAGTDNYIGDWFEAPCGWSTYNCYDISHFAWHKRGHAASPAKETDP